MKSCKDLVLFWRKCKCEKEEAKMFKRKKGTASWSDTACFLESHGEVICGGNQHEELEWVVCLLISLKHRSEYSRIGSEFLLQIRGGFASATASFVRR